MKKIQMQNDTILNSLQHKKLFKVNDGPQNR